MLARLISLLLLVLTRDGVLHRFDGHHDTSAAVPRAIAIATLDDRRVVVLADGKITVDGKPVRGRFDHERALAGGAALWSLGSDGVSRVDLRSGKLARALAEPRARLLAADGDAAFCEYDNTIVQIGTARTWSVPGRPIAMAAGDGKLWVATHEGPLWQLDRASAGVVKLELGDWWGTLGLVYADHALYAVTVAGKIWRIDPAKNEKTIVAMDGWQGAIDLAILR
jgi:hypothetical protein